MLTKVWDMNSAVDPLRVLVLFLLVNFDFHKSVLFEMSGFHKSVSSTLGTFEVWQPWSPASCIHQPLPAAVWESACLLYNLVKIILFPV